MHVTVVEISATEADQHMLLYEKLLALRSVRAILGAGSTTGVPVGEDLGSRVVADTIATRRAIGEWWDAIDSRYVLTHDEDRLLGVDHDKRLIVSYDKEDPAVTDQAGT